MKAAEVVEGLERLGIVDYPTQPYSPEQNAKQENFWTRIEDRLMPQLEVSPAAWRDGHPARAGHGSQWCPAGIPRRS